MSRSSSTRNAKDHDLLNHLRFRRRADSTAAEGAVMDVLLLLSEAQKCRIEPYFPLSQSVPRVDNRRVLSGIPSYFWGTDGAYEGSNANPPCAGVRRQLGCGVMRV